MRARRLQGWDSVYTRGPDGVIESDERITLTRPVVAWTSAGARELGERYWNEVGRATLGLVRMLELREGSELRLRLVGASLLRFGRAELAAGEDSVTCRFPIRGGVLAKERAGALVLSQSGDETPQLRAALTGFVPRLGSRPYDQIQRRVHVAISRRFFRRLLEERR
ncbi:MAG: hypothetical protein ACJ74D_05205 [Gaiellaceae bacterium]